MKNVKVCQHQFVISGIQESQYKSEPGFMERYLKAGAVAMGRTMLEEDLITLDEQGYDEYTDRKHYRMSISVVDEKGSGEKTFQQQLDDAKQEGREQAAAFVEAMAQRFKGLDGYGPVQAVALFGVGNDIRKLKS